MMQFLGGGDSGNSAVRRGQQANLAGLRAVATSQSSSDLFRAALRQLDGNGGGESNEDGNDNSDGNDLVLIEPLKVSASLQYDTMDEEETPSSSTSNNFSDRIGTMVITRNSVYFWCKQDDDSQQEANSNKDDLVVDAEAIELHALTENNEKLYVQIHHESSDDIDHSLELVLSPLTADDKPKTCQSIFDALSKLVSLHPINPNLDDVDGQDENSGNGPATFGCMDMGMGGFSGPVMTRGGGDNDEMMICSSSLGGGEPVPTEGNGEATPEERQAMLDRLDDLLVVPPELEQHEDADDEDNGQFDDADEDDDDGDDPLL